MSSELASEAATDYDDVPVLPAQLPDPALGLAVRLLREAHGLTEQGLAAKAGCTFGTISRLENALAAPPWETLAQIAHALGVSLAELAAVVEAEA
jgi:transcriptional regulator with XRE-family HTH domain